MSAPAVSAPEGPARAERHPSRLAARTLRRLRSADDLRGWRRLAEALVPSDRTLEYVVRNDGLWFAGNLESLIERQVYLYGGYERRLLDRFIEIIPRHRRDIALDVGANIGTHTLRFGQEFRAVHAFEPNPAVLPRLERNLALNGGLGIQLHKVGLADRDAELDFHAIANANGGLGTFSTVEQYDQKLQVIGRAPVRRADDYLRGKLDGRVDAVKIDVQGFEPEVLKGMREILEQDRPYVWFESAWATVQSMDGRAELRGILPFDFELWRFDGHPSGLRHRIRLVPVTGDRLGVGDFVAVPIEQPA